MVEVTLWLESVSTHGDEDTRVTVHVKTKEELLAAATRAWEKHVCDPGKGQQEFNLTFPKPPHLK